MCVTVFDFYITYMYTYIYIKVMETKVKKEKIYILHIIIFSADFNINWIFLLTYSIIMEDFKIGESELKNLTFQF